MNPLPIKALSIRQPWAWLIVNGWKNIENRMWRTSYRGPVLIHASKGMTRYEYDSCKIFMAGFTEVELPPMESLERGGIVGVATILDCVNNHANEWFCGEWGFVLADARPLPFFAFKGALSFFRCDYPKDCNPCEIIHDPLFGYSLQYTDEAGAKRSRLLEADSFIAADLEARELGYET